MPSSQTSPKRAPLTAAPLSCYAFARHVGVDVEQVLKGVRNGRLERSVGTNAKGKPCIANGALAEQEWRQHRDVSKDRRAAPGAGAMAHERKRLLAAQARRAELDNARKAGELVPARAVELRWSQMIVQARNALLGVVSKFKGRRPGATQEDLAALDSLIRESLEALADGADKKEN